MTRPILTAASLALVLSATPALPQSSGPAGWLDLISPDRLLVGVINTALIGLRTQAEISHDALTVDFAAGSAALTGLVVRPLPHTGAPAGCQVTADRVAVSGLTPLPLTEMALKVDLVGVEMAPACLPLPAQQGVGAMGVQRLALDRVTLDFTYTIASGAAQLALFATSGGQATVTAAIDLAYLAATEGRYGDPLPVIRFRTAELTVEDGGLLPRMRPLLSIQLGDLGQVGAMLRPELERQLAGPGGLTPATQAFVRSVEAQVGRFLTQGGQITLTAAAPAGQPGGILLDLPRIEGDPDALFAALNPLVTAAPSARLGMVPVSVLKAAIDAPAGLSEADRRRAGLALVAGIGAPRDVVRGAALLAPLAASGDGPAAMALARALAPSDPATAYEHALHAAAAGQPGALALLDDLEGRIGLSPLLAAQTRAGGAALADAPYATIGAVRSEALALMMGRGRVRGYAQAWYWASLGAAAGDAASAALRDEIEARIAARGSSAAAAWSAATAPLAARLAEEWMARDLPGRYGLD